MTHRKHDSHEFWAFLAGGALGASIGTRLQPQVTNIAHQQTYKPRNEVALPASRADHAEAVLGYLLNYQEKLLESRQSVNKDRSSLISKRERSTLVSPMVPMWTRPVFPEVDEIVSLLNRGSIWTIEALDKFSAELAREIFAPAIRGFRLIAPESIPHVAGEVEKRISNYKQEILLAISIHNEWVRCENSKVSMISMLKRDSFKKPFKILNIRVPRRSEIEERLRRLQVMDLDELYSAEKDLHEEVFKEVKSAAGYWEVDGALKRMKDERYEVQLRLYKTHRVKPPEWLIGDRTFHWKIW